MSCHMTKPRLYRSLLSSPNDCNESRNNTHRVEFPQYGRNGVTGGKSQVAHQWMNQYLEDLKHQCLSRNPSVPTHKLQVSVTLLIRDPEEKNINRKPRVSVTYRSKLLISPKIWGFHFCPHSCSINLPTCWQVESLYINFSANFALRPADLSAGCAGFSTAS